MSGRRKANPQDKVHPNKAEFIRAKYQMLAFVHRLPCRDDDSVTAKDLNHKNGQHFIIPQMADSSLDVSELAKAAKKKLQSLSNHLFEELAMDVYDEVDRRETDAVWLATQNHSTLVTETTVVPFLPVNPEYSSTRNQASDPGRQKLARFNAHEFATLVIDILSDAKRRQQQGSPLSRSTLTLSPLEKSWPPRSINQNRITSHSRPDNVELILRTVSNQHSTESQDNDQPDYDSVASDEDTDVETRASKAHRQKSLDSDLSDGPVTVQEFMEVKSALVASEAKIQQLMKVNNNLSDELRIMQKKLQTLQCENSSLRKQATTSACQVQTGPDYPDTSSHSSLKRRPSARGSRPMSMYETGSGQKPYLPMGEANRPEEARTRLQPFPAHIGRSALVASSSSLPSFPSTLSWSRDESARRASRLEKQNSTPESDYDNTPYGTEPDDTVSNRKGRQRSMVWQGDGSLPDTTEPHLVPSPTLPSTEDVIRKTEQITKNIQELLRAAQENKHDSYIPCSERIHVAVTEMAALFPKKPKSDTVRTSLRLLTSSAYRLQSECRKALPGDSSLPTDVQLVTQQVIQCAYDIAKAAKQLVTITTKENNN
ncbi:ARF GTPase-activating protein GIT2-like protein [Cricetulus griseus]|uniref:ARF GTPase-activating protein GIT2-like protein n=1 Tax=Cricetulus griseus TaxID=10029 RepID=A0A061I5A1_CRIGR|nr:ARF GTPase-activating protein GIT2-like protein [Cricetulus griseus]